MSQPQHKIMIVDDEHDLIYMVGRYLEKWNFNIIAFSDPVEALNHFQKNSEDIPLVLTDIRMPRMSGIELAQHMLRLKLDVKILLMTAYEVSPIDLERTLQVVNWNDILRKPFKLEQVCSAVKRLEAQQIQK